MANGGGLAPATESCGTAGDGGNDGEFIVSRDRAVFFGGEVTDVVIVEVDVDEGAERAVGGEEVLLHGGVGCGERSEALGYRGAFDGDGIFLVGVSAQWGGDMNLHFSIIADGNLLRVVRAPLRNRIQGKFTRISSSEVVTVWRKG